MKDIQVAKVKITEDMVGQDCFIANDKINCEYGEFVAISLHEKIEYRSLQQHRLLFAIFKIVAENKKDDQNFNTVEKVKEQAKLYCRYIDTWYTYYNRKTNTNELNIKTKSISFAVLGHLEACGVIQGMLEYCAEILDMELDILLEEAEARSGIRKTCVLCGKKATQGHHMFSQTKDNVEKYGRKLIDDKFNKVDVCYDCHSSHSNPDLVKYNMTEREFDTLLINKGKDCLLKIKDETKRNELLELFTVSKIKKEFDGKECKP